jgi:hypothetical protein
MKSILALGVTAVLCVVGGVESHAAIIGPGDFGPNAVTQTFDALPPNYDGVSGPLVIDGVTYSTSVPVGYRIANGPDCLSGSCFGTDGGGPLDNPVERVGGYLLGSTGGPYVTLYDANKCRPVGIWNAMLLEIFRIPVRQQ